MNNELLKVTGSLDVILQDEHGNIKQKFTVPNLVVTGGKNLIAERLLAATPATPAYAIMSHMAVGSDDGTILPLAAGNTDLGAIIGTRQAFSTAATRTNNVITYSNTFGAGVSTGAIKEAGIFNASTAGTMLCRTTFAVINKAASDVLTINWNVTIN